MFSRYDTMKASEQVDSSDNLNYPDPLSINYNNTQLLQVPKLRALSSVDLNRFWYTCLSFYGVAEGDDIVLTLNGVPYRGMLDPGDEIYFIDLSDIYTFGQYKKPSAISS